MRQSRRARESIVGLLFCALKMIFRKRAEGKSSGCNNKEEDPGFGTFPCCFGSAQRRKKTRLLPSLGLGICFGQFILQIDGTVDLSWFCSFAGHFSYSTKEQAPSGGEERWLHFFNYNLYSYRSEAIDSISCTFVMRSEQVSRIGLAFPLINSICKI